MAAVNLKLHTTDAETITRVIRAVAQGEAAAGAIMSRANYSEVSHSEVRLMLQRLANYIDTVIGAG